MQPLPLFGTILVTFTTLFGEGGAGPDKMVFTRILNRIEKGRGCPGMLWPCPVNQKGMARPASPGPCPEPAKWDMMGLTRMSLVFGKIRYAAPLDLDGGPGLGRGPRAPGPGPQARDLGPGPGAKSDMMVPTRMAGGRTKYGTHLHCGVVRLWDDQ